MATHSSISAWKITWTEEPGRLQSMESDMTEHTHMEKLEPLFIVVGKVNDVVSVGKSLAVPQKVKYINLKKFQFII